MARIQPARGDIPAFGWFEFFFLTKMIMDQHLYSFLTVYSSLINTELKARQSENIDNSKKGWIEDYFDLFLTVRKHSQVSVQPSGSVEDQMRPQGSK